MEKEAVLGDFKLWLIGLLFGLHTSAVMAEKDYSLMLLGGGLEICSSLQVRQCNTPLALSSEHVSTQFYRLSAITVAKVTGLQWMNGREALKQDAQQLLQQISTQVTGKLTKRQLLNHWRNHEVRIDNRMIRGGQLLQNLHQEEVDSILDVLETAQIRPTIMGTGGRNIPLVQLKNSKNTATLTILDRFVDIARKNKKKKETLVLFVTAAQRDPFADVDLYKEAFAQLGVDVRWLPLDLALFQSIDAKQRKIELACQDLPGYRAKYMNLYAREIVYPDLDKLQRAMCEDHQEIEQLISEADGLFFVEGEPHRLRDAFVGSTELASSLIEKIKQRQTAGQLVVAADDGAARAMVSAKASESKPVIIIEGSSHGALSTPSFNASGPLKGCEKYRNCPADYQTGSLTVYRGEGLGLFPYGAIDTRLSEMARQGRLVKAISEQDVLMGFGIDERTALLVSNEGKGDIRLKMEVAGENGVYVFDTSEIERDASFNDSILSVRNHYLTPDDRILYRHEKFVISFADWKYSKNQRSRPLISSGGAFKRDNYRRATKMLCSTGAKDATLQHKVVGKGHKIYITKSRQSISLAGQLTTTRQKVNYCSYRDYYLDITKI